MTPETQETTENSSSHKNDNGGTTEIYDSGMLKIEPEPLKMKRDEESAEAEKNGKVKGEGEEQKPITCKAVCSFYTKACCANCCNCCCYVLTKPFGR